MKENNTIKLAETVVLIDAVFMNYVVSDLKKHFEKYLKRPLQDIDITYLATILALNAGIKEGENKIQYLFVYDKSGEKLVHCNPSDLKKELNGVAFENTYGEHLFASISSEGIVSRAELYLDLLNIIADSADVKRMLVISFNEEYGEEVTTLLNKVKGKEILQLRMYEPDVPVQYKWDILAFPLMQALRIRGDELQ